MRDYIQHIHIPIYKYLAWIGFTLCVMACAEVFDLPEPVPAPRITSIVPDSGAANTPVVITGMNFSPVIENNVVKFNGKDAHITAATATQLTALVPGHAGTGIIEVVVHSKATEGPLFTFFETPVISSISPQEGRVGMVVTIQGKYFDTTAINNLVRFGGKIASVNPPATDTLLQAVVPADAVTGEVTVTVNKITGIGPRFTVLGTSDGPVHTITAISPASGTAGTVVTITGSNFNLTPASNVVKFNGVTAQVTAVTATEITAIASEGGSTGLVSVTIGNATVNGPTFTYVTDTPAPVITNLDPNAGPAGITVAIVGTNFSPDTAGNTVKFNGKTAVVTEASATLLKATAPEGAGTGPVTVIVNEKTSNGFTFTYLDNAPAIIDFTPKTGPAGTIVRISGNNFGSNNGAIVVKFNGVTTPVQEGDGGTSLTVAVPQGATTGRITVTVNNLTATSAADFVVTNTSPGTVTVTGSMNYGRYSHTATLLADGRVLVAGGTGNEQSTNLPCEIYDPATGIWTITSPMNTSRAYHKAFLLRNGKVLVVGGTDLSDGRKIAHIAELYDPATGSWTNTGSLNSIGNFGGVPEYRRNGFEAVMLADGRVLAAGHGNTSDPNGTRAEIYNPATGQWTLTGDMPNGDRILFSMVLLNNGKVLATGGNIYQGDNTAIYDPATNSWSTSSPVESYPQLHNTILLPDGKVLLIGGSSFNGALAATYLFDITTARWTLTSPLSQARYYHKSVLLLSGKVLTVGGQDAQGNVVAPVELYDPVSATWNLSGSTSVGRILHTVTFLNNGNVLITGGSNYRAAGVSSCELYIP